MNRLDDLEEETKFYLTLKVAYVHSIEGNVNFRKLLKELLYHQCRF